MSQALQCRTGVFCCREASNSQVLHFWFPPTYQASIYSPEVKLMMCKIIRNTETMFQLWFIMKHINVILIYLNFVGKGHQSHQNRNPKDLGIQQWCNQADRQSNCDFCAKRHRCLEVEIRRRRHQTWKCHASNDLQSKLLPPNIQTTMPSTRSILSKCFHIRGKGSFDEGDVWYVTGRFPSSLHDLPDSNCWGRDWRTTAGWYTSCSEGAA